MATKSQPGTDWKPQTEALPICQIRIATAIFQIGFILPFLPDFAPNSAGFSTRRDDSDIAAVFVAVYHCMQL